MKKSVVIIISIIAILIFGFILPSLIFSPTSLGSELQNNYQQAAEPLGAFLVTAKILPNQDQQYKSRCVGTYESVILQSYTWMMIPGPVIEACVIKDDHGKIIGMKSVGMIKK